MLLKEEVAGIAVKIQDVAKKAGVSISTVSRVLNGYKHVSDELKDKVTKAVEELEYRPNQVARSLASQRTNLIGIIVPDLTNHYYSRMISSIEEYASERNYNIVVCNIKENLDKEVRYLNVLKEMWADGIILMHEKVDERTKEMLKAYKIPVVLASVKIDGLKVPSVNIDDYHAAYDATNYLIQKGHERIGIIAGDMQDITAGQQRYRGFIDALKGHGIKQNPLYMREGKFKIEDGYQAMDDILDNSQVKPTAIFAVSDSMAIGAMNCAIDRGYQVPDDISIIGFDNIDLAAAVRPRLTTVNQPAEEIGRQSMKTLIALINGKNTKKDIILDHSIVEGSTCKEVK
ncbi:LacI family DNA-binding transcriptional regulator [Vallitalea okinawensis]|uniref:LacI family DNA-binding transcriptional regulator n=1 Tax=Vallitalea okinawensis TaxID=2078660 RepID=UPI001A9A3E7A|nr:LacI family DNA-binding transcriptional regulator [Vallitalea okinawensis]